jgi:hypothetical protein
MKKILTSLFLILSLNTFGQNWQERIARDFYSRIDSSKSFECCDKVNKAVSFEFIFDTYEMPYNSTNEVFDIHYENIMDSSTISTIVDDLYKSYNKIPKRLRKNFKRSCYSIEIKTEVSEVVGNELIFAQGKVHFNFFFQTDEPYKTRFTWKSATYFLKNFF